MFLFEHLIKLLIGNSGTLFAGLIMVVIGYCGWYLWNIKNKVEEIDDKLRALSSLQEEQEDLEGILLGVEENLSELIKEENEDLKEIMKLLLGNYRQLHSEGKSKDIEKIKKDLE